jgi:uncharacterized protein YjbJ (UPF0337 family)
MDTVAIGCLLADWFDLRTPGRPIGSPLFLQRTAPSPSRREELPGQTDVYQSEDNGLYRNETRKEFDMNWNQIEGNWEQFKGKAQAQWGKLTGDDMDVIAGNRKQLSGKIQEAYGKTQEEADREIDTWMNSRH